MYDLNPANESVLNAWLSTLDSDIPVSTYQGSYDVPFQRWFKFKEAFSPLLVKRLIDESAVPVRRCLDVCGGCGTTGVTSQFLGVEPTIIEVNPFLVDVIRAKLSHYDARRVCEAYADWCQRARILEAKGIVTPISFPETFVEKPGLDRWLYSRHVIKRIIAYRQSLQFIRDAKIRRLFRVLLGSILVEVSNVVVNGKGRKYRENWEVRQKRARDVDLALELRMQDVIYDMTRYEQRPALRSTVIHGDSRKAVRQVRSTDIAIFSPPYPNSFDYTDIYNLELWVLGYIRVRSAEIRLRRSTIRSHVQRRLIHDPCEVSSLTLRRTLKRLRAVQDTLWNGQIPNMIDSYFHDLGSMLLSIKSRVAPGGEVAMIVADSAYAGIIVPVGEILAELGDELGYRVHEVEKLRTMKSSAQQGWKPTLREEIVRLRTTRPRSVC